MLTVAVLGPLEIARDGRRIEVPSGKASELVVRLALEAGAVVRTDLLLEDLWSGGGAGARRNTLQSKVAMLRRALGDPGLVTNRDGGYALDIDPSAVDALAAVERAATAAGLLEAGDDHGAVQLAASTLELYRGEVLQAAGDGAWVGAHRARLDATRMELVDVMFTARLRLGDGGDLIGGLEEAVTRYPFQERLWELLITALYRAGRQADALATYRSIRRRLSTELGLDPRPQLQQLEQRILAQDPSLDLPARGSGPVAMAGNLPAMTIDLVGRDADVDRVSDTIADRRLVELVGPGGVGKTAVAIAVGRRLAAASTVGAGGVWLARLESARNRQEVMDVLVAAFRGPGGEAAVLERLRRSSAVLVLDNCEHVVDAVAELVEQLLAASPELRILCTSQVPLGVDGEVVVELAPLRLDDAVELFSRRADERLGRERGTDASVPDLCRSLDGLPLAIELAAARTRTLSVSEITRRLADRFGVLSDPTIRRPERRRALRSTIGWSYDLLFPDDQRGLWALAAFADGAPLPALESVLEALGVPTETAIDVVGRLVSRSLVIVDVDGAEVRYRLLDSIRAFALEAMADAGVSERAAVAHGRWIGRAAEASTAGVRSARQAEHLGFARTERSNIDAALAWAAEYDPALGLRIANGFGWAWVVLGDTRGAQRIVGALGVAGDGAAPADRATALLLAAWIEASTGRVDVARGHVDAARALADAAGDTDLRARCGYYLAYVVSHEGGFREAMALTASSAALYDGLDRPWDQAANALFASRAAISAGDRAGSTEAARQVDRWLRAVDDPWLHVRRDAMHGELARLEGRFDEAVRRLGRAAEESRRLGFQQTEAYQVMSLGRAQCQAGDYDAGSATLRTAIGKSQTTGDVRLTALTRVHLGRVLRALGQDAGARAELEAADVWHRESGGGEQETLGSSLLAALDAAELRSVDATERLQRILETAEREENTAAQVFALDALARSAAVAGDLTRAHELSEAADLRMDLADHFITDLDRVDARWVRESA